MLTQYELKEILHYNTETGIFTWKKKLGNRIKVDKQAGRTLANGYVNIGIYGKRYYAHRLAWLYTTGDNPKYNIDHIDGNPSNNAFNNLRDVSQSVNIQNQISYHVNNKSGFLGVSLSKKNKKWMAQITLNRKVFFLGYFDNAEEAHEVYLNAKRELHAGCTI